jgi:hypothetical protein
LTAHLHGQLFNASSIAASLGGISHTTVMRYLDSLVDTMMLRRLEPHFVKVGKRLVKSPKVVSTSNFRMHPGSPKAFGRLARMSAFSTPTC